MPADQSIPVKYPQLFFCAMAATAMMAEILLIGLISRPNGFALAFALHLAVVLQLLIWAYNYRKFKRDGRMLLLLVIMTAVTGAIGAGICLLTAIFYSQMKLDANYSSAKWISEFSPYSGHASGRISRFAQKDSNAGEGNADGHFAFNPEDASYNEIEPFNDILLGGTVLQKQMAIAKITQHFQPRFAPLLLNALSDGNAAVRVQAATAIAKIERDFMRQYLHGNKKNKNVNKNTKDHAAADLQMANLCDHYAYTGILDEGESSHLRAKAIEIYEGILERSHDPDQILLLARLYLRDGEVEKSCQLLERLIESGSATGAAIVWYMEVLFRQKEFSHMRWLVKKYAHLLKDFAGYKSPDETSDTLKLWGLEDRSNAYAA